jgi:peptidoglycan/LPS O-acetylase OafA/YrhL
MLSSKQPSSVPSYSIHLDAMRAFAALVVFLGHARFMFIGYASQAKEAITAAAKALTTASDKITWGHQAVVVFFVLSGYLVGGSVLRDVKQQRWSWQKYLTLRLTRLWVVLIPALVAGYYLDHFGSTHFAGTNTIYNHLPGVSSGMASLSNRLSPTAFLGNILFLQTIRVDFFGTNNALWSLANEFWYYIAFPFMVLALSGKRSLATRLAYGAALLAVLFFVGPGISAGYVVWLSGVAALLIPYRIPERWQPLLLSLSLVLMGATCVFVRRAGLSANVSDYCLAAAFFGVLYCALHRRQPARPGLYQTVARSLSHMSYTLYLVHVPALTLLCAWLLRADQKWSPSLVNGLRFASVLSLVLLYACIMYFCFEANTAKVRNVVRSGLASLRARTDAITVEMR